MHLLHLFHSSTLNKVYFALYIYIIIYIQTNTFQCVLATDGVRSFTWFLYLEDGIQWGEGAQIGFDAVSTELGDTINDTDIFPLSFSLPGALQNESVDIDETENTGIAGKWAFRLDPANILQAGRKSIFLF